MGDHWETIIASDGRSRYAIYAFHDQPATTSPRSNILPGTRLISVYIVICECVSSAFTTLLIISTDHLDYRINDRTVPYITAAIDIENPFEEHEASGMEV
jgi:hypothetical protein